MIVLGYILAGVMGILLGMMGGGGSILTVPILVYLMGVPEDAGPSNSFFVVGVVAAIGAVQYLRSKQYNWAVALLFGIPSVIAVFLHQWFVRPAIPATFHLLGATVTRGALFMGLFAVMMVVAAWSMIRKKSRQTPDNFEIGGPAALQPVKIMLAGLAEGMLTGLIGAGGGFIIVPVLVNVAKLPMKKAVGTSLLIMAVKSLIGFGGSLRDLQVDWAILLPFTGIAALGILVGATFVKKVQPAKLKVGFGWFVLGMGIFVIVKTIVGF